MMKKSNLYDHNVYQKQEFKKTPENLSPQTKEKRNRLFSGQQKTGVELRKKMNDDLQDFMDLVDQSLNDSPFSNEEIAEDIPDPEKADMFSRKYSSNTPSPMPKHYGEATDTEAPKIAKSERKIGNHSYKELAALPTSRKFT